MTSTPSHRTSYLLTLLLPLLFSVRSTAQAAGPKKIFMITDMEGVSGIFDTELQCCPLPAHLPASRTTQSHSVTLAGAGWEGRPDQDRIGSGLRQSDRARRSIRWTARQNRPRWAVDLNDDRVQAREGGSGNHNDIARIASEPVW